MSVAHAKTPAQVLAALLQADPATPRMTFYERTPGPMFGERIELSGKVLANWVAKAANMLAEEFDISGGDEVLVDLPTAHWRTAYWALAAWSVGASVRFIDSDSEPVPTPTSQVLVTCRPQVEVAEQIVVTLPALARSAMSDVPSGAFDEARELSTFSDFFTPTVVSENEEILLRDAHGEYTCAALCAPNVGGRRYLAQPTLEAMMQTWSASGSVVVIRGEISKDELTPLLTQEDAQPS